MSWPSIPNFSLLAITVIFYVVVLFLFKLYKARRIFIDLQKQGLVGWLKMIIGSVRNLECSLFAAYASTSSNIWTFDFARQSNGKTST